MEDEEAVRGEQRDDTTLCVAARWRHRLVRQVSNTAWRRNALLQVLWRDVDHLATGRDEVLWRGTGIPQSPAAKEDLRGFLGNGHIQRSFQYAVGDHIYYRCDSQVIPLITFLTVD
jgi:hypothetical protein